MHIDVFVCSMSLLQDTWHMDAVQIQESRMSSNHRSWAEVAYAGRCFKQEILFSGQHPLLSRLP